MARLGYGGDGATVGGVVAQLGERAARVGGHRHHAEFGAGIPAEERLRAVVEMQQQAVTRAHAAPGQSRRQSHRPVAEGGIAQHLGPPVEGLPDQEGVAGALPGLLAQQPGHVQA
jgi:hypothetical protein